MELITKYIQDIKDIQKKIDYDRATLSSNEEYNKLLDTKLEIYDKFLKDLEPYCRNLLPSKNKYFTSRTTQYGLTYDRINNKLLTVDYIKDKKVFLLNTPKQKLNYDELTKQYNITFVKSPTDADIILYSDKYTYSPTSSFNLEHQYKDKIHKLKPLSSTQIKSIKTLYDIFNNKNCEAIHVEDIVIYSSDDIISREVIQSLSMMLKTEDKELYKLAWETLWKYDYKINKYQILEILAESNKTYFKNNVRNHTFKLWKKQFPAYFG
jgi:hypothetical protein